MKPYEFYKRFEAMPKERRFELIETRPEATSMFVIFQQLGQVRAQKKYFEDREIHLLQLAELGFEQISKKNGQ